jgi:hypothetical protein
MNEWKIELSFTSNALRMCTLQTKVKDMKVFSTKLVLYGGNLGE